MAIEKYTAVGNLKDVIDNKDQLDAHIDIDIGTANAYIEGEKADANLEEVQDALTKQAEVITPEAAKEEKVSTDNMYTKKFKLDEGIAEFVSPEFKAALEADSGKDPDDKYLNFDMFEFIYSFVTDVDTETQALITQKMDTLPSYQALVSKKRQDALKKFRGTGYDNYQDNESDPEATQVSTSVKGDAITVYGQTEDRFDWVKEICDMYQLKYTGPVESKVRGAHWAYAFTIHVPMAGPSAPMMVTDYFEDIGIPLEDVMPPKFIAAYNKRQEKERAEMRQMLNDSKVEKIYDKWKKLAGSSSEPLEQFINGMLAELSSTTFDFDDDTDLSLQYSRNKLKRRFLAEFEDDFEDEE